MEANLLWSFFGNLLEFFGEVSKVSTIVRPDGPFAICYSNSPMDYHTGMCDSLFASQPEFSGPPRDGGRVYILRIESFDFKELGLPILSGNPGLH
jgi:hypothetical protein